MLLGWQSRSAQRVSQRGRRQQPTAVECVDKPERVGGAPSEEQGFAIIRRLGILGAGLVTNRQQQRRARGQFELTADTPRVGEAVIGDLHTRGERVTQLQHRRRALIALPVAHTNRGRPALLPRRHVHVTR